jgi:hypothetical protein
LQCALDAEGGLPTIVKTDWLDDNHTVVSRGKAASPSLKAQLAALGGAQRPTSAIVARSMFTTEKARTKWAAPFPDQPLPSTSPPKNHNHCAEELVSQPRFFRRCFPVRLKFRA